MRSLWEKCVLVIEGKSRKELKEAEAASWETVPVEEHMKIYEKQGMSRKDAMKQVAKDRGVSKREILSDASGIKEGVE